MPEFKIKMFDPERLANKHICFIGPGGGGGGGFGGRDFGGFSRDAGEFGGTSDAATGGSFGGGGNAGNNSGGNPFARDPTEFTGTSNAATASNFAERDPGNFFGKTFVEKLQQAFSNTVNQQTALNALPGGNFLSLGQLMNELGTAFGAGPANTFDNPGANDGGLGAGFGVPLQPTLAPIPQQPQDFGIGSAQTDLERLLAEAFGLSPAPIKPQPNVDPISAFGGSGNIFFSDPRLKDNVEKIGEIKDLSVYKWDWAAETKGTIVENCKTAGFMADEVQLKYPHHVYDYGGYMTIDYPGLLNEMRAQ